MRSTILKMGTGLAVLGILVMTRGAIASSAASGANLSGHVSLEGKAAGVGFTNVIISLEGIRQTSPPLPTVALDQKDLKFVPHVVPVLAGSPLVFRNSDPVLHSIKTTSTANPPRNSVSVPGKSDTVVLQKPENITVGCSVHSEMRAYILVKENPWFTRVDAKGNYALRSVPAGDYTLRVWTEKTGSVDQKISVPASGSVVSNLTVR